VLLDEVEGVALGPGVDHHVGQTGGEVFHLLVADVVLGLLQVLLVLQILVVLSD